jgi:hypothetical protein
VSIKFDFLLFFACFLGTFPALCESKLVRGISSLLYVPRIASAEFFWPKTFVLTFCGAFLQFNEERGVRPGVKFASISPPTLTKGRLGELLTYNLTIPNSANNRSELTSTYGVCWTLGGV